MFSFSLSLCLSVSFSLCACVCMCLNVGTYMPQNVHGGQMTTLSLHVFEGLNLVVLSASSTFAAELSHQPVIEFSTAQCNPI